MAVIQGSQVKLDNGQLITPQTGGWYDGQQYWNGSLSAPGQINTQSNQPGAGTQVSNTVVAQTNPNNVAYLEEQKKKYAQAPQPSTMPTPGNASMPGVGNLAGPGTGVGFTPTTPTIDLPKLYESLYANSGIKDLQDKLAQYDMDKTTADAGINDNPFLSEATRVGRIAKTQELYDNRTRNIRDQIATVKADIETQLNLQTKQFDINSQAAKDSLSQFNALLEMGALDNASGEDIANITKATGLSSGLIASAINSQKTSGYQTSVQSFDDGDEEGFIIYTIDQGGNIVNQSKQVTGTSGKTTGQYSASSIVNSEIDYWKNQGASSGTSVDTGISSLWIP